MEIAVVGTGFEGNGAATLVLGGLVLIISFLLVYWRYKREKK
ncbi:LPXTG cell wall anchor domain-containing protein [Streptomyces sp. NPDC054888]